MVGFVCGTGPGTDSQTLDPCNWVWWQTHCNRHWKRQEKRGHMCWSAMVTEGEHLFLHDLRCAPTSTNQLLILSACPKNDHSGVCIATQETRALYPAPRRSDCSDMVPLPTRMEPTRSSTPSILASPPSLTRLSPRPPPLLLLIQSIRPLDLPYPRFQTASPCIHQLVRKDAPSRPGGDL